MNDLAIAIRQVAETRWILVMKTGAAEETFDCPSEREAEARGARCSMAIREIWAAMGLRPLEVVGNTYMTAKPTPEQFSTIVDIARLHLSGVL